MNAPRIKRRAPLLLLVVALVQLLNLSSTTDAFPTGAGQCTVGAAAVGSGHTDTTNNKKVVTGPASSEHGYQLSINDQVLTPNTPLDLLITTPQEEAQANGHTLVLAALLPTSHFKGFSIILSSSGQSNPLEASLGIVDASTQKLNNLCRGGGAPTTNNTAATGVTHTSAIVKDRVELTLTLPPVEDEEWLLDITIVVQNQNGISEYYYSQYYLVNTVATSTNNSETILELVAQTPDLQTLSSLFATASLNTTELYELYRSWTLLAPTDAAFQQVDSRVQRILTEPDFEEHLMDLLYYHAARLTTTAQTLYTTLSSTSQTQQLVMGNQELVNVTIGTETSLNSQGPLTLNGGEAIVIREDFLNASDGIVHVVDQVLLPASATLDIVGALLANQAQFSTLVELLTLAGLVESLQVVGPFSMFAPTNDAFAKMDPSELEYLRQSKDVLVDVLSYHATTRVLPRSKWEIATELTMLNGKTTTLFTDDIPRIATTSSVTAEIVGGSSDGTILVNNGIIHSIDAVLIPAAALETLAPTTPPSTIQDLPTVGAALNNITDISQFRSGLQSVNIDKLLSDDKVNFTIFAPLDVILLANEDYQFYTNNIATWNTHLTKYLEHHIIEGRQFTTAELFSDGAIDSSISLAGDQIGINADERLIGGNAILESFPIASNGIVHTVSDVLIDETSSMSLADLLLNGIDTASSQRVLQESSQFSVLVALLNETGLLANEALSERSQDGTTLIAPTDTALDGLGGLENVNDFLLYHLVEANLYQEDLRNSSQRLLSTLHPTAQLWLTVDQNGVKRYNDVVVQREVLGKNG